MEVDLDQQLTPEERAAIFALLYTMAKADGFVAISEQGLLGKIHRSFFGAPVDEWSQPDDASPRTLAEQLDRPASRSLALRLLYEMVRVDGMELDDEIAFFAECARRVGLEHEEVRTIWNEAALEIFERSTRDLVARRFGALGRELAKLRRGLYLGRDADRIARRIVEQALDGFELP